MKKNKKRRLKSNKLYTFFALLMFIVSAIFIGLILWLDILPTKFILPIFLVVLFVNVICGFLLIKRNIKTKIKKIFLGFSLIFIIIMLCISFYLYKTLGFLLSIDSGNYKISTYSVVVLKDSKYNKINDIKKKDVGYFSNSDGYDLANKKLKREVSVNMKKYDDIMSLGQSLLDSDVDAILIESSMKSVLDDEMEGFTNKVKVIYTFTIRIKVDNTAKDVDVTSKPFVVFISGIDTYGEIATTSRSDVNMAVVVNPKTNQILLISIPRDYYVQISGTTGRRDKLTHAGLYGVERSIATVEDLLDIDINYYFKVNFTSVEDIVDALGGISVYSDYNFTSKDKYKYIKGYNNVNGKEALSFARERYSFNAGDRQRVKNQQAVIEGLIRKVSSKAILTKYNSLLNSMSGKFQSNMGTGKMTSLVKFQLKNMPKWTVSSFSLNGADSHEYTYSCGSQKLYVMIPYEDSITQAKELINSVLNGEKLPGSYVEYTGGTDVVVDRSKEPVKEPKKESKEEPKDEEDINESEMVYIITIYDENKSNPKSQNVKEGSSLNPIAPAKEGYKFLGWRDIDTDLQVNLTDIKDNMEIYPYYEEIEEEGPLDGEDIVGGDKEEN